MKKKLNPITQEARREAVRAALEANHGNVTHAAKALGFTREYVTAFLGDPKNVDLRDWAQGLRLHHGTQGAMGGRPVVHEPVVPLQMESRDSFRKKIQILEKRVLALEASLLEALGFMEGDPGVETLPQAMIKRIRRVLGGK